MAKSEKPESVTLTIAELEKLVDERVKKALKQQGVRHAKSPAPRVPVNHGRYATSAGYIDTRTAAWWKELREGLYAASEENRAACLDQLRAHRASIRWDVDPAAQKLDELFAEFEQ